MGLPWVNYTNEVSRRREEQLVCRDPAVLRHMLLAPQVTPYAVLLFGSLLTPFRFLLFFSFGEKNEKYQPRGSLQMPPTSEPYIRLYIHLLGCPGIRDNKLSGFFPRPSFLASFLGDTLEEVTEGMWPPADQRSWPGRSRTPHPLPWPWIIHSAYHCYSGSGNHVEGCSHLFLIN